MVVFVWLRPTARVPVARCVTARVSSRRRSLSFREVLEELEAKMADVLSPTPDGELVGSAEVQTIFEIGKLGKVAGCMIKVGSDDVAHKDLVS